jgi:hypothetical protein
MPYRATKAQKRKSLEKIMTKHPEIKFDDADRDLMERFQWNTSTKDGSTRLQTRHRKSTAQATRLIASAVLGRELESHERVRSINGQPLDLRRDNLIVTNTAELIKHARDAKKAESIPKRPPVNTTCPTIRVQIKSQLVVDLMPYDVWGADDKCRDAVANDIHSYCKTRWPDLKLHGESEWAEVWNPSYEREEC